MVGTFQDGRIYEDFNGSTGINPDHADLSADLSAEGRTGTRPRTGEKGDMLKRTFLKTSLFPQARLPYNHFRIKNGSNRSISLFALNSF